MGEITIRGTRAQQNLMEWSRRVADCRSSGMSVTRWCSEHNVKSVKSDRLMLQIKYLYFDLVPYQRFHDGGMTNDISNDEDLARSLKKLPCVR